MEAWLNDVGGYRNTAVCNDWMLTHWLTTSCWQRAGVNHVWIIPYATAGLGEELTDFYGSLALSLIKQEMTCREKKNKHSCL